MMTPPRNVITYTVGGNTVYHLGTLFDGAVPAHLGPYTVGATNVPAHWWNARWTDRQSPVQIKRTPAELVAANRMFPMGNTGCVLTNHPKRVPYSVMGTSNIALYMPTTGEREDIGWITDISAFYMLGLDPNPMLDWAQANDSCPLHFRDETTGKPVDLLKYPQANDYEDSGAQGKPFFIKGPKNAAGNYQYGGGFTPQNEHFCEMSYVAHQATLDLVFLENVQYNANFMFLCDAAFSDPRSGHAVPVLHGNARALGWGLRNLFMAHVSTLDSEARGDLPASCHPSSYFKKLLDNNLAYYSKVAADPKNQTFRTLTDFGRISPWENDYLNTSLAFGVLTGHTDWVNLFLWSLGNTIFRTSNLTGYPPGMGTAYRLNCYVGGKVTGAPNTWKSAFDELVVDPEIPFITQAVHDKLVADPLNGGKAFLWSEYMMTTRAVLVMADYLDRKGLAPVRATYPEFDAALGNAETMFKAWGKVNPRVSVVSTFTQPPPSPPVGALIMSLHTASIQVGQHIQIGLQVSPPGAKLATGPDYSSSNPAVADLTVIAQGTQANGLSEGLAKIIVSGTNPDGSTVTGECDLTVTAPFVQALDLVPGAIS